MKNYKIAVVGAGYVGLSIATLEELKKCSAIIANRYDYKGENDEIRKIKD